MKLLIITPLIPYPLIEGGKISQFSVTDALRNDIEITYFFQITSQQQISYVEQLKTIWSNVTFYSYHCIPPKIKYVYISKIINVARRIKNYLSKNNAPTSFYNNQPIDISMYATNGFLPEALLREINKTINIVQPDIIQVEHTSYMSVAKFLPTNIPVIFIHHEVQFARLESFLKTQVNISNEYKNYLLNISKGNEFQLLEAFDGIITFSQADKNKLDELLPQKSKNIFVSPFGVLHTAFYAVEESNFKIEKLVFVGGEAHFPNRDAVTWFITKIYPKLLKETNIPLHVIGEWSKNTIQEFKQNTNILFKGVVEDIKTACANSIMIVPIRIGSGIRTKILYAMAQQIPVVTTLLGCEGIVNMQNKENVLIADKEDEFVNAILLLIQNLHQAFGIAKNGQSVIQDNYSPNAIKNKRTDILKNILQAN